MKSEKVLMFTRQILLAAGLSSVAGSVVAYLDEAAPSCLEDRTVALGYSGHVNCTANDLEFVAVGLGTQGPGCLAVGDTASIRLRTAISSNTGQTRYDIGLWFAQDGGTAENGDCVRDYLFPVATILNNCTFPNVDLSSGDGPFFNDDGDFCGDIEKGTCGDVSYVTDFPAGEFAPFPCLDDDNNGFLNIGSCISWGNNVDQVGGVSCSGDAEIGAGEASKCNCNRGTGIPINTNVPLPNTALSCNCTFNNTSRKFDCSVGFTNPAPAVVGVCAGGSNVGYGCTNNGQCSGAGGTCAKLGACVGGTSPGASCDEDAECSGGGDCVPVAVSSVQNRFQAGTASYVFYTINDNSATGTYTGFAGSGDVASPPQVTPETYTGNNYDVGFIPRGGIGGSTVAPENGVIGPADSGTLSFTYTNSANGTYTLTVGAWWSNSASFASPIQKTLLTNTTCQVNVSATYALINHTYATLENGQVVFNWQTAAEAGTQSFDVLREDTDGTFKKINSLPIPAVGGLGGGRYSVVDSGATPYIDLSYKIVEHEYNGLGHEYGPFSVNTSKAAPAVNPAKVEYKSSELPNARMFENASDKAIEKRLEKSKSEQNAHAQKQKTGAKAGTQLKMSVNADGVYNVDSATVAQLLGKSSGQARALIQSGRLRLYNRGKEIAWEAGANGGSLRFYGEGNKSQYSRDNAYWLVEDRGMNMGSVAGSPATPVTSTQSFRETIHTEKNLLPRPFAVPAPDDDFVYWALVLAGTTASLTVETPGAAASGTAVLKVLNPFPDAGQRANVIVNGQAIGEIRFASTVGEISVPQSALRDVNTVEIRGISGFFLVDSIDVEYDRLYRARENGLAFRGDNNPVVTVSGFATGDIVVYDITDPTAPKRVNGLTVDNAGGSYRVTLVPGNANARYVAAAGTGIKAISTLVADAPSSLRDPASRGDLVIVAPGVLVASAKQLADLRRADGYEPVVVDLADVMDEFGFGNFDPRAIQAFIAHASKSWQLPPKVVVLSGKGHFDYLDELGLGGNLMPPMMARTTLGYVSADTLLGDVDGDGKPDIPVGRIPVLTAQELTDYVGKLAAYANAPSGPWLNKAIIAADNTDPAAGDFPADSELVAAALPVGMNIEKTYLYQPYSISDARQRILDGLRGGALFVNLTGHGSPFFFTSEQLLARSDVPTLGNLGGLPVVNALSCLISIHAFPGWQTLGEDLVLNPGGGALALWGPTGLSVNGESVAMGRKLAQNLFAPGIESMGARYIRGLRQYTEAGGSPDIPAAYSLIGDPSAFLRMQ